MRLGKLAKIAQTMYTDRLFIFRRQHITNPDGTTDFILPEIIDANALYQDIPCRLSFFAEDSPLDDAEASNPVFFAPKVYVDPDVDLQAGDWVVVYRGMELVKDKVVQGRVTMPAPYPSHLQAEIRIKEDA